MWRTWRRHETDTKFFDTKSDREPYHGRTHTLRTQSPRPQRAPPGPREMALAYGDPGHDGVSPRVPGRFATSR